MKVLRREYDKDIQMYCYLIKHEEKLYFIHSVTTIPTLNKDEFNDYIIDNNSSIDIVAIEDVETINNHYHVGFLDEMNLTTELFKTTSAVFIELVFLYSINQTKESNKEHHYMEMSIIYQSIYGCQFSENILNREATKNTDFSKEFVYMNENGYDYYTFFKLHEGEISEIMTYACKHSFRDLLFNTKFHGIITDKFLFETLTTEEFSQKICMTYRMGLFTNSIEVEKKLKSKIRVWKINYLLNPNFLIKNSNVNNV